MTERDTSIKVVERGGRLFRELPDGSEELMPSPAPGRSMTEAETDAAALSDPDNLPSWCYPPGRLRPRPRAFIIRRALNLTQEEFAAKFQIPVGTVRDWEQGRVEPDQAARAYLRVIAYDPEIVLRALTAETQPVKASE